MSFNQKFSHLKYLTNIKRFRGIKKTRFNILLILVATVISCSKDITTEDNELNQNLDTDDLEVNLEGELQVSDFVWKGLNEFYYWQEDVSELSDEKLNDEKEYD